MNAAPTAIESYPMVEAVVTDFREVHGLTTDRAIERVRVEFDVSGPYAFAKRHGQLVAGSGEEFAVQFMGFYNDHSGRRAY